MMATTRTASLMLALLRGALLPGVILFSASAAGAQTAGRVNLNLLTITSVDCTFPVSAIGSWKGAEPTAQVSTDTTVSAKFDNIDTQDMIARLATGTKEEVILQASRTSLHFVEIEEAGRVAITTVFARESAGGRLRAVHSRVELVKGGEAKEPLVAQDYGDCAVTR